MALPVQRECERSQGTRTAFGELRHLYSHDGHILGVSRSFLSSNGLAQWLGELKAY